MKNSKKSVAFSFSVFLLVANVLSMMWPTNQISVVHNKGRNSETVIVDNRQNVIQTVIDAYITVKVTDWVHKDSIAIAENVNSKKGKGSV